MTQAVIELEVGAGEASSVVPAEAKFRRVRGRRVAVSVVTADGLTLRFQVPVSALEIVCRELES